MSRIEVSVLIDDAHLSQFASVVKRAKRAGLKVEQELKETGVLIGTIESSKLDALRKVEGIASVEQSREIKIAPPESEVQ